MNKSFLLVLICIQSIHAQITYVEVQASGQGSNAREAINSALIEAIGMVNGRSIENETSLRETETSSSTNDSQDYFSSEAYESAVKTATKGTVSNFNVLAMEEKDGLFFVSIRASVAKLKLGASALRTRIAVFPLRVGENNFTIGSHNIVKSIISRMFSQGITANLVQSRRFTVLDREYIQEHLAEKANILYGDVKTEEMARIGQELAADMILVGTIENFVVKPVNIHMQLSNTTVTTLQCSVNFAYRLVDTATKQIKFADSLDMHINRSELQGLPENGSLDGIEASICKFVSEKISIKILEAIYPVVVVSARGKYLTLGQGGNNLKQGDRMEIFFYGDPIFDPYNNEKLGREEVSIGYIEITRVNSKTSTALYTEGEFEIESNFEPKKFLCRSIGTTKISASEKKLTDSKKKFEERRKARSSLLD
jgi:hypothetical protein